MRISNAWHGLCKFIGNGVVRLSDDAQTDMKKLIAGAVTMMALVAAGAVQAAPLAGTYYNLRTTFDSALPVGGVTGFDAFTDMSNSSPGPDANNPSIQWGNPMLRNAGTIGYQASSDSGLQAGHADASHDGFLSIQEYPSSGVLTFAPGVRGVGADFFGSGGTDIGVSGGPCDAGQEPCKWEANDGATITVRITDVNGDTYETTLSNIGALDDTTRFFGFISATDLQTLEFFIPEEFWIPSFGPFPSVDSLKLYSADATDVPLPGTLALLGIGLLGAARQQRRRSRD